MEDDIKNCDAFECPYCQTLNEHSYDWKGSTIIICGGCDRRFYGEEINQKVYLSRKILQPKHNAIVKDAYEMKYKCYNCSYTWNEIYSCACDSECPECEVENVTAASSKLISNNS